MMRSLNLKEQEFCKIILSNDILSENVIEKICLNELNGLSIEIDQEKMRMEVRVPADAALELVVQSDEAGIRTIDAANHQKLVTTIVASTQLINMLESNGLIYIFQNRVLRNRFTIGPEIDGNLTIVQMYADRSVLQSLITYLQSGILITSEFEEFIKNGFQTRDDYNKRVESRKTQNAIYISLMAIIVSMIGILADCSNNATKDEFDKLKIIVDSLNAKNKKVVLPVRNLGPTHPPIP